MPLNFDSYSEKPGVYLMKNKEGEIIYVGKGKSLKKRIKQYFIPGRDDRPTVPLLVSQVCDIDTIVVSDEKEALLLENALIKKHQPKFNILLKDDKNFISLCINHKHKWPLLKLVRTKTFQSKDLLFFGPYTNAYAARSVFELMNSLFQLRQCSDAELNSRTRPCLLYSIKRCLAPCTEKCTQQEYHLEVEKAVLFLKGKDKSVIQRLQQEMEEASERLDYEKAGALLKTIRQIKQITDHASSTVVQPGLSQVDVIGLARSGNQAVITQLFFRNGLLNGMDHFFFTDVIEENEELIISFLLQHYTRLSPPPKEIYLPLPLNEAKTLEEIFQETLLTSLTLTYPKIGEKRNCVEMAIQNAHSILHQEQESLSSRETLLLDLQDICTLTRYPKRIESFDTSNLSGGQSVAAMITYIEGKRNKQRTRYFRTNATEDYGALKEILKRRYTKAKQEDDLPDLILIDGGKGQLTTAFEILRELEIANVDVISLVKEKARHDKGMTREKIFVLHLKEPISLDVKSPLLMFLQNIRDETHRAAISYQRRFHKKATFASVLDDLPNIGPIKKKKLLTHFGSIKRIKEATEEELKQVKGLSQKDIDSLLNLSD